MPTCTKCFGSGYVWIKNFGRDDLTDCNCQIGRQKTIDRMPKKTYLDTLDDFRTLGTNSVACKECLVVMPNIPTLHYKAYMIEGSDLAGLVTCMTCYNKGKPVLPPKDVVSIYHNRRKLRIRKR